MNKQSSVLLKKYWGFDSFRHDQEEVIESVLAHQDTLAIMPTGAGKSLCYQIPALIQKGMCLVISPLIALMEDQVNKLKTKQISAALIHSGMSRKAVNTLLNEALNGHIKILYLSPERLVSVNFRDHLHNLPINFVAVDEAHCICEWGYDFRPSYLEIANIRDRRPHIPFLALTASATPKVQKDIEEKLQFRKSNRLISLLKRDNLSYHVMHCLNKEKKLIELCTSLKGSGIIYLNSRRGVERIHYLLQRENISSSYYHAGLEGTERLRRQMDWVQSDTRIMVATNAFGMGIDKADVRFVLHTQLPMSIEAYYQESGRAGRDQKKAYSLLLYNEKDKITLTRQFNASYPTLEMIQSVYKELAIYYDLAEDVSSDEFYDFDYEEFTALSKMTKSDIYHSIKQLISDGWIQMTEFPLHVSKVKFIIGRELLYNIQIANPKIDVFSKALLRSYEGLFSEYTPISEKKLGSQLNISENHVIQFLKKMHSENIIDYKPAKSKPQISFLKPRIRAKNLIIDQHRLKFRRDRHLSRINAVISYAEHTACREVFVLNYFGERGNIQCGHCDLCIRRNKASSKNEIMRIQQQVDELIEEKEITLESMLHIFSSLEHNIVVDYISLLEQENKIQIEGEIIKKRS